MSASLSSRSKNPCSFQLSGAQTNKRTTKRPQNRPQKKKHTQWSTEQTKETNSPKAPQQPKQIHCQHTANPKKPPRTHPKPPPRNLSEFLTDEAIWLKRWRLDDGTQPGRSLIVAKPKRNTSLNQGSDLEKVAQTLMTYSWSKKSQILLWGVKMNLNPPLDHLKAESPKKKTTTTINIKGNPLQTL